MSYDSHLHNVNKVKISDPENTNIIKADGSDRKPSGRTDTRVKNIGSRVRMKRLTDRYIMNVLKTLDIPGKN